MKIYDLIKITGKDDAARLAGGEQAHTCGLRNTIRATENLKHFV